MNLAPVESSQTSFGPLREARVLAALLFLTVATVFLPALKNDFISYDDPIFVSKNPVAQRGWTLDGFKWAFTSVVAANWHPVTNLSHLTDCELFGVRPWGHHLTSVLLHAANATLLFVLLRRMTGALWRSLFAAAFFGLHPLRVESVAWVAERKDVLSVFFFLLTLLAYHRYAVSNRKSALALALFCFALGLMSKAMLVTTPFLLLLLDYWPLARATSGAGAKLLLEKIPFALLAAAACVVTLRTQGERGVIALSERFGFGARAANAVVSYTRYIGKTLWPANLALPYPYVPHWAVPLVIASAAVLAAACVLAVILAPRQRYAPVGWFWFLGALVPVIGLVQVGEQALADRYSYLPGIGLAILLAWGGADIFEKIAPGRALPVIAASASLAVCAWLTQRQLGYWQSTETLFSHAVAVTDNNATALGLLADALAARGDTPDAMACYRKAIALNLTSDFSRNNYGLLLLHQGKVNEAIAQFNAAALSPDGAMAHLRRGLALEAKGQTNQAQAEFRLAQELDRNESAVENNLGVMCARSGQDAEARDHFQRALLLKPGDGSAWANLGQLELREGRTNGAIADFTRALQLDASLSFAREQLNRLRR